MSDNTLKLRSKFPSLRTFNVRDILNTPHRFKRYEKSYTMSKDSMAYRERVTPLKIEYRLTLHANDRLEMRNLSEADVMETITRGTLMASDGEFHYKYKYFKVITDRQVDDSTKKVVVITAMYTYEFITATRTCQEKFMANRKTMINALKYVYDEIGHSMYKHPKKVYKILEEYGFVYRDSFFGESILSVYSGKRINSLLGSGMTPNSMRKRLKELHDEIMNGNPADVMSRRLSMDPGMVGSITVSGKKYVYTRSSINGFDEKSIEQMRDMVSGKTELIHMDRDGVKMLRGSRYDLVMVSVGKVNWIVDFNYHPYLKKMRETYLSMAIVTSDAESVLNAYIDALGMFVYAKEDAELKHRSLVKKLTKLNRITIKESVTEQERYLEATGLTFG